MIEGLRLREPSGVAPAAYRASSRGVVAFAVVLGIQLTALAMIALGPLATPLPTAELTEIGRRNVRPQLDLPVFYAGCVATLLLVVAGAQLWSLRLRRLQAGLSATRARTGVFVHWILAAASLWAFVAVSDALAGAVGDDGRMPAAALLQLASVPAAALGLWLCFVLGRWRGAPSRPAPDRPS